MHNSSAPPPSYPHGNGSANGLDQPTLSGNPIRMVSKPAAPNLQIPTPVAGAKVGARAPRPQEEGKRPLLQNLNNLSISSRWFLPPPPRTPSTTSRRSSASWSRPSQRVPWSPRLDSSPGLWLLRPFSSSSKCISATPTVHLPLSAIRCEVNVQPCNRPTTAQARRL